MSSPPTSPLSLSERLQDVTEALAAVGTQKEVFKVVLQPALEALNAIAGAVLLVSEAGDRLETAALQGYQEGAQTVWEDGPLSGDVPAGDALERHEPLFFEQEGALVRAYPELEARTDGVAAVATAVLPMFLDDRPLGVIILDFKEPHTFTPEEGRFLRTLAAQCAIAAGRARLTADLQRQVQERTRKIEAGARAQEAFVAFTEAVGTELDVITLAQRAVDVLQAHFVDGIGGYYEREGELWKLRSWTRNLDAQPDFIAALCAGLPSETPFIAQLLRERTPVFTESWDAEHEGIQDSEDYGTVAAYPVMVGGEVRGFFTVGFKNTSRWAERDRAIFRAVGHSLTLALERTEQAQQLQARKDEEARRTQALQAFAELSRDLVLETDPLVLIRRTQEVVLGLLPPGFSLYYEPEGGRWHLRSQVGQASTPELQAALGAGFAFEVGTNMLIPHQSGEPHFQDEYDPGADQLSGSDEYPGATVVLPVVVRGQSRGVVGFALSTQRRWSGEDRAVLETVGRHLTLALERAEQTRALEEERAALAAFARFTEESTHTTDALTLAAEASAVLRATLNVQVGYSELEGGLWKGRVFSDTTPRGVVEQAKKGFPADVPSFARPFTERDVVFVDGWDAHAEGAEHTEVYTAAALYPYVQDGQPHGLLTMGSPDARTWTERERTVFRSVGRSLALAFERAATTRALQVQNAELDARTRVLEAFEEWTRDLTLDAEPDALIKRAEALLLDLLPVQAALYYERDGERWYVRSMRGEYGSEGLRLAHEAGLPHDTTDNLRVPSQTGETYYQDVYDHGTDGLADQMVHVSATAIVPLRTGQGVRGLIGLGRFGQTSWTGPERAIIETVRRSLELALDRADRMAELAQERAALSARTTELAAANEELEAFSYSVSHDLRTPVRHVMSFNDLLRRHLGEGLDAKAARYLTVVGEAASRMNTLIDAMLDLSRTSRLPLRLGPVDLGELVQTVQTELEADTLDRRVEWEVGPLPLVTGDHDTLRQVVVNLLDNALKYTRTQDEARIEMWAEEHPGEWVISVRDNGVGFDPQYADKLFGVFQRLHLAKDFEGTGVGLANVRRIMARHGGRVWAESRPGEGATFRFSLPRG